MIVVDPIVDFHRRELAPPAKPLPALALTAPAAAPRLERRKVVPRG